MEHASLAREVARGNGLQSKVLKPAAIRLNQKKTDARGTLADASLNTYHSPLYPLLLGAVFRGVEADNFDKWRMGTNEYIYELDRVVTTFSIICFFLAIGVVYLLLSRIFDGKIAGATAILMMLCELFWDMSMSGLPQMLMLLLFSSACYFAYRAFEATYEGRITIVHALLAAIFFSLLCLTHWLAVWIALGYAIAAAIFIRPRGVAGLIALIILAGSLVYPILQNLKGTGNVGGVALLVIYEGLAGSEEYAMRSLGEIGLNLRDLLIQLIRSTIAQTEDLYSYFGAIAAAPIFFISLFHSFKRPAIASFRWAILIMWISASLGMAFFGLKENELDPNQLHLLFAPLMAGYGLAMLSVLWARLDLPATVPFLTSAHLMIVILVSSTPFLLRLPKDALDILSGTKSEQPNYPPYAPSILDEKLADFIGPNEIVASDQPWAVAWYADRTALWLPLRLSELEEIENMAESEETPIVAVLTSPISSGTRPLVESSRYYNDYLSLMLDGWAAVATRTANPRIVSNQDRKLKRFFSRYPHQEILSFRTSPLILYTSRRPGT